MKYIFSILALFLLLQTSFSQKLEKGFDAEEYMNLLCISARQADTPWTNISLPNPERFKHAFRSNETGLYNMWDLWVSEDMIAVISIRGTVANTVSWLENFHAGMIPATGSIKISEGNVFDYHLAKNPKANIHTGWTIALASIAPMLTEKVDSLYKLGYKDYLIIGHSQGGAIAYLITSYLHYLINDNILANDVVIKTYCSAAPKPGNLEYAYDYEQITYGGWAFNVVNPLDWIPQGPVSIQNANDFTEVNPFTNPDNIIKSIKWPARMVFNKMYNKLTKPLNKSTKRFEDYLGKKAGKYIQEHLKSYEIPEFTGCQYYVRVGQQIILEPDSLYLEEYVTRTDLFQHHTLKAYYYLASKLIQN